MSDIPMPASPRAQRLLIVGAVAAGTSVGAKARRNDEEMEIVIYERDRDISYSGCGLPYFIGGTVPDADDLHPRDAAWFAKRYNIDIRTGHEVISADPAGRTLQVRDRSSGEVTTDRYDSLVLATGATSIIPPVPGVDLPGVFALRSVRDAEAIKGWLDDASPKQVVVVGSGFIGLEVAEQLVTSGISVTLVERLPQVMPALDADMAFRVQEELERHGVTVRLNTSMAGLEGDTRVCGVRLDTGELIAAQLVILAVGVRPNTDLARDLGVTIGETGAIAVDPSMRTNVEGVYAVGDCAESYSVITGRPLWRPLGSTANKMGRIAGDQITGGTTLEHRGILGTGIVRVFELAVGHTGLTETQARAEGFDPVVLHNTKPAHATYLGGKELTIKAVADRASGRLLGAQAVGPEGVDKRIDVLATAITFGATVADLFHLDLAYSPPFATTKDPVHYTGMALETAVRGRAPLISPTDLDERLARGERIQIVDVRAAKDYAKSHLPGAVNIPLADLRRRVGELDPQVPTVTYCNKGVTGNAAQNVLLALGLAEVMNLSGGNSTYQTHTRQMQRATSLPSTIKPSHLPHVLFLCVHNAGKSQMAGALMRHLYGDRIVVTTAGTGPDDAVDDASARIVAELGASTAGEHPKAVTAAMLDAADRIILIGPDVQLTPPEPLADRVERWPIHDPAEDGIEGDERTRNIRDQIANRVHALASELTN